MAAKNQRVTYLDTATSQAAEKLKNMMNKRKKKEFQATHPSKRTMEELEGIEILDRVYDVSLDKKKLD